MAALTRRFQEGLFDKTELAHRKQRLDQERQTMAERIEKIQRQQAHSSVKTQIMADFAALAHG